MTPLKVEQEEASRSSEVHFSLQAGSCRAKEEGTGAAIQDITCRERSTL